MDHLQAHHMPPSRSVAKPVAARIVEGQDAAHRRHAARRRIRTKLATKPGQIAIELPQHDTRLDRDRIPINAHDATHRTAEIDD